MEEIWKDIPNYEGLYQVSNLGRVKSLSRLKQARSGASPYWTKEKLLKPVIEHKGYLRVRLYKDGFNKGIFLHQVVAMAFLGHTPCGLELVVNHINFDKTDNRVENLELVTVRENSNKKHLNSTSEYTGVCKIGNKWQANIFYNGNLLYLGVSDNELQASKFYESALVSINNGEVPKAYQGELKELQEN